MPQRLLQTRLHLHVPELTNGEVQVFHSLWPFIGVVLQQQLSQLEACEGNLRAEAYLGARFQGLVAVGNGLISISTKVLGKYIPSILVRTLFLALL